MRKVVVTGGNRGIGRAIVQAILASHADTRVFMGSRDAARGHAARAGLLAQQPDWAARLEVLPLDVSSDASVTRAAAQLGGEAPLYGLVNNAGIGTGDLRTVLNVNTLGVRRVCEAFLPLLQDGGRVVNVSSASGPSFVSRCGPERQAFFTDAQVRWPQLEALADECATIRSAGADFAAHGLGDGRPYGLSKAMLNSLTMLYAREHPSLKINACTPGFIETDMTRQYAAAANKTPAEMGMRSPEEGSRSTLHLLFSPDLATGQYFGSDALRSPLDRYRSPGDPPYTGG